MKGLHTCWKNKIIYLFFLPSYMHSTFCSLLFQHMCNGGAFSFFFFKRIFSFIHFSYDAHLQCKKKLPKFVKICNDRQRRREEKRDNAILIINVIQENKRKHFPKSKLTTCVPNRDFFYFVIYVHV